MFDDMIKGKQQRILKCAKPPCMHTSASSYVETVKNFISLDII